MKYLITIQKNLTIDYKQHIEAHLDLLERLCDLTYGEYFEQTYIDLGEITNVLTVRYEVSCEILKDFIIDSSNRYGFNCYSIIL